MLNSKERYGRYGDLKILVYITTLIYPTCFIIYKNSPSIPKIILKNDFKELYYYYY